MNICFERNNNRPIVYLVGFHDSGRIDGEVFLSSDEAELYCKGKVVHVKPVSFGGKEIAMTFLNQMARRWINHIKSFDRDPTSFINEIECLQFKGVVLNNLGDL